MIKLENKIRVLFFTDEVGCGGIHTFLCNTIKFLGNVEIEAEILCLDSGSDTSLDGDFTKMGVTVHRLKNIWLSKPIDFIRQSKALFEFFKLHNNYDIVHLNASSKNFLVLKKAKEFGIKTRISHSHSIGFQSSNFINRFIGNCFKPLLRKYTTDYFACSKEAGIWLFGKKISNSDKFHIIPNGIDVEKFRYNSFIRNQMRKKLLIEDLFVVGDIGRFVSQKNYGFLIDIFKEILELNPKSCLIIVGDGPTMDDIKDKVFNLGISDKVKFLGFKQDQYKYLQAMDVFVLPSLLEGLGIVLIEAQAAGLPCFTSTVVPREVKITKLLEFISLKKSAKEWAKIIINNSNIKREDTSSKVVGCGYDIKSASNNLLKIFKNLMRKNK